MQRQSVRDLPPNKNPTGTRCIQITIPDDDEWERDLYGEIYRLTRWMLWERDIAKSGKPVADRWLEAMRTWAHCDGSPATAIHGMIEDFQMPIRVDCDCNVWITCCDGTEKQLLTKDQVEALMLGQPGAGATQPPAGGGCTVYHGEMQAAGRWLVPTIVNTGDTIAINNAVGAGTDGIGVRWFCPDGVQFFAGVCVGSTTTDGADPLPSEAHMALIIEIDGTFYFPGSTFTVPGGVSNQQVFVQLNDGDLADNSGSYTFDVEVCNNAAASWTQTFDFQTSPNGFTVFTAEGYTVGQWLAGQGWSWTDQNISGETIRGFNIEKTFLHPSNVQSLYLLFDYTEGDLHDPSHKAQSAGTDIGAIFINLAADVITGTNATIASPCDLPASTLTQIEFWCDNTLASPSGDVTLKKAIYTGIGPNPFV